MYRRRCIWPVLVVLAAGEGDWVYDWPYGAGGECRCKRLAIPVGEFTDERSCREAFSREAHEYCWTVSDLGERIGGITEHDCAKAAVSVYPTMTNMDCEAACLKVVVGSLSPADFLQTCKLETVVQAGSRVAPLPGSGCFSNFVLGHADFNPAKAAGAIAPLKIFVEVESAPKCQALCQQLDVCAWFQWRAVADDACNSDLGADFQRAPGSCELYDYRFVESVLAFDVDTFGTQGAAAYVSGVCDLQQYEDRGCSDLFKTSSWKPFGAQKCLSCDCERRCAFTSRSHISGPAYCEAGVLTDVCSIRPPFEHTTPPAECSTTECVYPTTEGSTELSTTRTRPETQSVYTTALQPGKTTARTQEVYTTETESTTGLMTITAPATSTTAAGASVTTVGEKESTEEGTSTTSTASVSYTTAESSTELETTTELITSVDTHPMTSGDTHLTNATQPCKPCPPCPEGKPDCVCECIPCMDDDDDCRDAYWEAEDLLVR